MLRSLKLCWGCRFLLLAVLLIAPFAAQSATVVIEARVAAGSDDAEQRVGSHSPSLTSSDLELVTDGTAVQTVGMRFAGLGIPRGAVISDAWLQFHVDEATLDAASLTLRAQAADNAPTFSSASNNVGGRATGSAAVAWTPAPWPTVGAAGLEQRAQGLAPLIQEVVNRPGWAYGNALVLLATGSGRRTAEAFEGSSSRAPLLHLSFDSTGLDYPPSLTLLAPADHTMFGLGDAIGFSATASDESGDLTPSLTWTSNRDGALGNGGSFVRSNLSLGTHTITVTARDAGGQTSSRSFALQVVSGYHVLLAAGDIAGCSNDHDAETAALLDQNFGTVVTLGDNVYPNGTLAEFQTCYGSTWGRHKGRTRPATGNHDFQTPNAAGYFGYFGAAAGPSPAGYYSFDAGAWHVVVLNSECAKVPGGCARNSPQGQWLAADLASHPNLCTLAIMHRPRFGSSGTGDDLQMFDFWQRLYEAGADVVLAGHQHGYERFDLQSPTGQADPHGLRSFIVGTGGTGLGPIGVPHANSVVLNDSSYGVLKLTLYPSSYDWQFLPVAGSSFTDSGSGSCVNAGPVNGIPSVDISAPAEGSTFPANTAVSFSAAANDPEDGDLTAGIRWSSDRSGLLGIGGTLVTSALPAGAHRITASSTDGAGGVGTDVVNITISVAGATTTTQHRVAAGVDDAEERVSDGRITLDSSDLELIFDGRDQLVGLRFAGVAVPRGAAILDAYVQFQVDEVSTGPATLSLQVEASDDAAPFAAIARNVSLRPRTAASVSWSPPDWPTVGAAGAAQRTPGLASLIQQVVDRPGWVAGNDLALIVTGSGWRVAEAFEGGAAKAPLLVIQYNAP